MRVSAVALLLVAAPFISACGDDEPDGIYTLMTVDGEQLPAVEDGFAITAGALEVREDSLIWTETFVFDYGTTSPHEVEFRTASAYEVEGDVIRALPEAFVIPDDTFMQCAEGGVYRRENGGTTLRMIDIAQDGECLPVDPDLPVRVYRAR